MSSFSSLFAGKKKYLRSHHEVARIVPCVVVFFSAFFFFFFVGGYLVPGVGGGPCFVWFFPLLFFLVLRLSAPDELLNALGRVGVERERGREEGERESEIEIEIKLVLSVSSECSQPGLVCMSSRPLRCPNPMRCPNTGGGRQYCV
jgi:hypothetical protein